MILHNEILSKNHCVEYKPKKRRQLDKNQLIINKLQRRELNERFRRSQIDLKLH